MVVYKEKIKRCLTFKYHTQLKTIQEVVDLPQNPRLSLSPQISSQIFQLLGFSWNDRPSAQNKLRDENQTCILDGHCQETSARRQFERGEVAFAFALYWVKSWRNKIWYAWNCRHDEMGDMERIRVVEYIIEAFVESLFEHWIENDQQHAEIIAAAISNWPRL